MRVAVTGGSGRIGCFVVRELVSRGHEVINIDRRQADDFDKLSPGKPLTKFVYADLGNREAVQPALENVEAVCHLGEIPSINGALSPEEVYFRNTRAGSVVMQTAADLKLRRVIYTSSCQVYGMWAEGRAIPQRMPFDETQPLAPQNAYALGKAANEGYARIVAERYGLSIAVFRLPWVTGDAFSPESAEHWRKQRGRRDGFGTYLHATDAARAFALALEKPRDSFEAYHFCAAEVMSFVPLAEQLKEHHPGVPPLPGDWPPFKSPVLTGKAREHFGWEPAWNFLDHCRAHYGCEPGL